MHGTFFFYHSYPTTPDKGPPVARPRFPFTPASAYFSSCYNLRLRHLITLILAYFRHSCMASPSLPVSEGPFDPVTLLSALARN
jgi:hypothetical protein